MIPTAPPSWFSHHHAVPNSRICDGASCFQYIKEATMMVRYFANEVPTILFSILSIFFHFLPCFLTLRDTTITPRDHIEISMASDGGSHPANSQQGTESSLPISQPPPAACQLFHIECDFLRKLEAKTLVMPPHFPSPKNYPIIKYVPTYTHPSYSHYSPPPPPPPPRPGTISKLLHAMIVSLVPSPPGFVPFLLL